jgi:hypothetical protein
MPCSPVQGFVHSSRAHGWAIVVLGALAFLLGAPAAVAAQPRA